MTYRPTYKTCKCLHNQSLCTVLVVLLCVIISSCDNSPEQVKERTQVRIDVDWSDYGKETPTGMTVICHHTESGETVRTTSNNTSRVTPRLTSGLHHAMVFNFTEEEFGNIRFHGLESPETAEAYASVQDAPQWYTAPADGDNYIAGQPEWLATDTILTDGVEVTSDSGQPNMQVIGTLQPRNIVYNLHITVRTENIGNLRAVRGAIGGLASGRKLAGDSPNDNDVTVTHIIGSDSWTRRRTSSSPDTGVVEADVRCFGLPAGHGGTPEENRLELHVLLADGKTVMRYDLPVGHLISEPDPTPNRRGDNLDLHLEWRLDPPLPPGTGSGGMDVWLDEWDDQVNFDVPI